MGANAITLEDITNSQLFVNILNHVESSKENLMVLWDEVKKMDQELSMALMLVCSIGLGAVVILIIAIKEKLSSVKRKEQQPSSTIPSSPTSNIRDENQPPPRGFAGNDENGGSNPSAAEEQSSNILAQPSVIQEKVLHAEVDTFETATEKNGTTYTAYLIRIKTSESDDGTERFRLVRRRYSEFQSLYQKLRARHRTIYEFPFPPKAVMHSRSDRRQAFDSFVKQVLLLRPLPKEFIAFILPTSEDMLLTDEELLKGPHHRGRKGGMFESAMKHVSDLSELKKNFSFRGNKVKTNSAGNNQFGRNRDDVLKINYSSWLTQEGVLSCCVTKATQSFPIGVLKVDILEALDLPASDYGVSSDPYCVATLTGYWSHGQEWVSEMRSKGSTSVKQTTLNPKWDASFAFEVPRHGATIRFDVYDWDVTGADDKLASVEVPLEALLNGHDLDCWLKLKLAPSFNAQLRKLKTKQLIKDGSRNYQTMEDVQTEHDVENKTTLSSPRSDINNLTLNDGSIPLNSKSGESSNHIGDDSTRLSDNQLKALSKHPSMMSKVASGVITSSKGVASGVVAGGLGVVDGVILSGKEISGVAAGFVGMNHKYIGKDACIHVRLQFDYALWGEIISQYVWDEDPPQPVHLDFDIDLVLTEVFKTLRMIKPFIQYFVSDDNIGVLDHFNWARPVRSATWLLIFTIVYGFYPQFAWPLSQAYFIYVSLKARSDRKLELLRFRAEQHLRRLHHIPMNQPLPPLVARELALLGLSSDLPNQTSDQNESDQNGKKDGAPKSAMKKERGSIPTNKNTDVKQLRTDINFMRESINKAVTKGNSRSPDFYGRPDSIEQDPCKRVGVYYDIDEAKELDWNWMPKDDFEECKFEVKGVVGSLLDQLITIIKAPWMNKIYVLLLKINSVLDSLHECFDWRNVNLCKGVIIGLSVSILVNAFIVPFNLFLMLAIWMLYLIFTPLFKFMKKYLLLPVVIPRRYRHLKRLKNGTVAKEEDKNGFLGSGGKPHKLLEKVLLSETELDRIYKTVKHY